MIGYKQQTVDGDINSGVELEGESDRPAGATGVALTPLKRDDHEAGLTLWIRRCANGVAGTPQ